MDSCTEWELNDMIDNLPYLDRTQWETARLNAYVTAQVNSRKQLTQKDILTFKWENKEERMESDIEISNEDIDRLKKLSKQWENRG